MLVTPYSLGQPFLGQEWPLEEPGELGERPCPQILKYPLHSGLLPRILSWCLLSPAQCFSTNRLGPKNVSDTPAGFFKFCT